MNEGVLRIHDLTRQAIALGTSMERLLAERHTMPRAVAKLRAKHLRQYAAKLGASIERALAWNEAVSLAFLERTGQDLEPGEAFTETDANRALEILKLYPTSN